MVARLPTSTKNPCRCLTVMFGAEAPEALAFFSRWLAGRPFILALSKFLRCEEGAFRSNRSSGATRVVCLLAYPCCLEKPVSPTAQANPPERTRDSMTPILGRRHRSFQLFGRNLHSGWTLKQALHILVCSNSRSSPVICVSRGFPFWF